MGLDSLVFDSPRSKAAAELGRLIASRAGLEARLDALNTEQQHAGETLAKRSVELVELERRSAEGEEVTPAASRKAEDALAKAKVASAAPWAERRDALRQAIAGHQGRVQRFVAEHFAELVEEVEQDGAEAAQAVDDAATKLVEAALGRDRCSKRLDALVTAVHGHSNYGDVSVSRADAAVREATRLLQEGGEAAPVVRQGIVPGLDVSADESADEPEEAHAA